MSSCRVADIALRQLSRGRQDVAIADSKIVRRIYHKTDDLIFRDALFFHNVVDATNIYSNVLSGRKLFIKIKYFGLFHSRHVCEFGDTKFAHALTLSATSSLFSNDLWQVITGTQLHASIPFILIS